MALASVDLCDRSDLVNEVLESLGLGTHRLSAEALEIAARRVAHTPALWADLVPADEPALRLRIPLMRADNLEVLLLIWPQNEPSDWHDHGGSSGGYAVVAGRLVERWRDVDGVGVLERHLAPGSHGGFGATHLHDMVATEPGLAVSVHTYSPPMESMTYYARTPLGFVAREVVPEV